MGRWLTGDRVENVVQVLILLAMGGMAGAVSFTHVHDWTTVHGQQSWVGWTNAMVTELTSVAGGLEVRRRKRADRSTTVVMVLLLAAVAVSLTAQVSQAEPTVSGWIVAALPQLGLLAAVKIVLGRTAPTARTAQVTAPVVSVGRHAAGPDRATEVGPDLGPARDQRTAPGPDQRDRGPDRADQPDRTRTAPAVTARSDHGPDPVTPETRTGPDLPTGPHPDRDPVTQTASEVQTGPDPVTETAPPGPTDRPTVDRTADLTAEFDPDLVTVGRAVLADLQAAGESVNRGTFAFGIRANGQSIATNTAGALLRALKQEAAA